MKGSRMKSFSSGITLAFIVVIFILLPFHHHNHDDSTFHANCFACTVSAELTGIISFFFLPFLFIPIVIVPQILVGSGEKLLCISLNEKRAPPVAF